MHAARKLSREPVGPPPGPEKPRTLLGALNRWRSRRLYLNWVARKPRKRTEPLADVVARLPPAPEPPARDEGWHRIDELVTLQRVEELLDDGVPWLVEWCAYNPVPELTDDAALATILDRLVGRAMSRRRRTVPTALIAEEWRNDASDAPLLLFVEQDPYPRADPGPLLLRPTQWAYDRHGQPPG